MRFLSGVEDEGVIFEQRQRIGSEFVQHGITQNERWLRAARALLLPKDICDVVSAKGASSGSFLDRMSNGFGSVLADKFEQFGQLARESAIAVGDFTQVCFDHGLGTEAIEKQEQALLSS